MALLAASSGSVADVAYGDDLELMRAISYGDGRAQRSLANRVVVRLRRAAHAFMAGSSDADDAAQHALIEVLRSAHAFTGEVSIERWADLIAGRSIVRFARAVRRRNASRSGEIPGEATSKHPIPDWPSGTPRPLSACLSHIPSTRREVLLLKYTFGQSLEEIAEITQASTSTVLERLLSAQRELRILTLPERPKASGAGPSPVERWAELRDREALGEHLSTLEQQKLEELERTNQDVRVHVSRLHELAAYLGAGPVERPSPSDLAIVERALAAVQITSQTLRTRAIDPDADLASAVDPEGPTWIRAAALAGSVVLGVIAVIALALFEPRGGRGVDVWQGDDGADALSPTVEALTTAHTQRRGARLRRDNRLLEPGAALSAGDELSSGERSGCFVLQPNTEVCLAAESRVRIASLALRASAVELLRGRVTATHREAVGSFSLTSGAFRAQSESGVFSLEQSGGSETLRLRVLEGEVAASSPLGAETVGARQMLVFRGAQGTQVVEPLPSAHAEREAELRAATLGSAGRPSGASGVASANAAQQAPSASEPEALASTPAVSSSGRLARELLAEAFTHLQATRFAEAAALYETILREHPTSDEAQAALVRLADVKLHRLNQPAEALRLFDRYLQKGDGPLKLEVMRGRIDALAKLGRTAEERLAIEQFLATYPTGAKAAELRARLAVLDM